MNGILKRNSSDLFHQIRKEGNRANHHGLSDYDRALRALKYAHQLAWWFYRTHCIKRCKFNIFVLPPDQTIEWEKTAQELSSIKEVNQALADRLNEKELHLLSLENNEKAAVDKQLAKIKELKQLLE